MEELESLLDGIESGHVDGLLADSGLVDLGRAEEDLVEHDNVLESLEAELQAMEAEERTVSLPAVEDEPLFKINKQDLYDAQTSQLQVDERDRIERKKQGGRKTAAKAASKPPLEPVVAHPEPKDAEPKIPAKRSKAARKPKSTPPAIAAEPMPTAETETTPAKRAKLLDNVAHMALPAKVLEKAANLTAFVDGRQHLSRYTRFTLEQLRHKDMSVVQLRDAMAAEGWGINTAKSQCQQQSRLLRAMGICDPTAVDLSVAAGNSVAKAVYERMDQH